MTVHAHEFAPRISIAIRAVRLSEDTNNAHVRHQGSTRTNVEDREVKEVPLHWLLRQYPEIMPYNFTGQSLYSYVHACHRFHHGKPP